MKLKKPKFWDYKKPTTLSNLLYPISKIVELFSKFKINYPKKIKGIKTICIGNIYLGGTGKTSIAIEIKKILDEKKIKSCFIKKYYPDQIDEQTLLKKFGKTFVDKSRYRALKNAASEDFEIAIFDVGLQDKNISYDLSFVCFNKKNMCGNNRIIPSGPLRESLINLNKYKNIIFSGNDDLKLLIDDTYFKDYQHLEFYYSSYQPINLNNFNLQDNYLAFSGIGNHNTFIEMLKINKFNIFHHLEYPDHYNYTDKDLTQIFKIAKQNNAKIITTEKDFLRLDENNKKNIQFVKVKLNINKIEDIIKKICSLNESF